MSTIVVFCGPPCSGKTEISRMVQRCPTLAGWARFAMDELRLAHWPFSHTAQDRANAYGRMHELAAEVLRNGVPGVILDATYQPSQQRYGVHALAEGLSANLIVFECKVSPDDAVSRFRRREANHAATDLSAEKVWDLADDFPYYEGSTLLDTSGCCTAQLVDSVIKRVEMGGTTEHLELWVSRGNAPVRPSEQPQANIEKLTSKSRRGAWRRWVWGRALFLVSVAFALMALAVVLMALVDPFGVKFGVALPGDPGQWAQVWLGAAVVVAGLFSVHVFFVASPQAKQLAAVKDAGRIPRLGLLKGEPPNRELYRRYWRRLSEEQQKQMLIKDVPLWFVVPPRPEGYVVATTEAAASTVDTLLLERRAAMVGLDWNGYLKWRIAETEEQYFDSAREKKVRVVDLVRNGDMVILEVCRGNFKQHLCTELSANLHIDGRFGYELRQLLEGPAWVRSDPSNRNCRLELDNVRDASKTHEMLLSVQVGLTTDDGYLILQRRSDRVQSARGGVTASGAGGANWDDVATNRQPFGRGPSLIQSAIRETREEIGWVPHRSDQLDQPFLGAAFSLLRGRDLNFYAHFHTHWSLREICADAPWLRRVSNHLLPFVRPRPKGATFSHDAWEVAHLIPVPVEDVREDGSLREPLDALIGDGAIHIRGLLFCLAQSKNFRALQSKFISRRND